VLGDLFAPTHVVLILLIALIVFGPSRLPEIGRGLGQAIRGFRAGLQEGPAAPPKPGSTPAADPEAEPSPKTSDR
jgi:sec-independent protein translocase protein TatA